MGLVNFKDYMNRQPINEFRLNGVPVDEDDDDFNIDDDEFMDDDEDYAADLPETEADDAAEDPEVNGDDAADDADDFTVDDTGAGNTSDVGSEGEDDYGDDDDFILSDDESEMEAPIENQDTTPAPASTESEPTPPANIDGGADETAPGGGGDDFTMDDNAGGEALDQTAGAAATPTPDAAGAEGGDAAGGADDFTMGDNAGGDAAGAEGAEGGDAGQQAPPPQVEKAPANPTDGIADDELKASEQEIYDSLTDDQKRIRTLQLKIDYKGLYATIQSTLSGIDAIPKTADNLDTTKKLVNALNRSKDILISYLQTNFDTSSYIDNYVTYLKFMNFFRTVSKVIEEMNANMAKNKPKNDNIEPDYEMKDIGPNINVI